MSQDRSEKNCREHDARVLSPCRKYQIDLIHHTESVILQQVSNLNRETVYSKNVGHILRVAPLRQEVLKMLNPRQIVRKVRALKKSC